MCPVHHASFDNFGAKNDQLCTPKSTFEFPLEIVIFVNFGARVEMILKRFVSAGILQKSNFPALFH